MKYFFIINTSQISSLTTNPIAINWLSRVKYRVTNITSPAGLKTLIAVRLKSNIEIPDNTYDSGTVKYIPNPAYDPDAPVLINPDYDTGSIYLQESLSNPNYVPGTIDELLVNPLYFPPYLPNGDPNPSYVPGEPHYIRNPEYGEFIPNPDYNPNHITGKEFLPNPAWIAEILNPAYDPSTASPTKWVTAEAYMNWLVNQGFITTYYTIEDIKAYILANWYVALPPPEPPTVIYERRYYIISLVSEFIKIRPELPNGNTNPGYDPVLAGHVDTFLEYASRHDFYNDKDDLRLNNVGFTPRKVCVELVMKFDEALVAPTSAQNFVINRLNAGVANGFILEYYPWKLRSGETGDTIKNYYDNNRSEWETPE